jgi:chromosome segregation protein
LRAAADEAAAGLADAERRCEQAAGDLAGAVAVEEEARGSVAAALAAIREADAAAAEVSGRLGRLAGAARGARDEAKRLEAAIASAAHAEETSKASLAELEAQLASAQDDGTDHRQAEGPASAADGTGGNVGAGSQPPTGRDLGAAPQPRTDRDLGAAPQPRTDRDREILAEQASAARGAEMEARLDVRTAEERLRAIAGRADALVAAAAAERQAIQRAGVRRAQRAQQALVAGAVAEGARRALASLAGSLAAAAQEREAAQLASQGRSAALKDVRAQVRQLAADFDRVVNTAHGTEMARAEHRMKLEQLAGRAGEEFGLEPVALVAEYGPDTLIPPAPEELAAAPEGSSGPPGDEGAPIAQHGAQASPNGNGAGPGPGDAAARQGTRYVRAEQERRAAAAQRQLDQLGKVNPLALEEFAALEERHAFLATQLEDLKKTRRDLLTVVKEVDDRVQEVFASAFEDTAREFEAIFGRLFPGGEGRLILTEPDDMLATGIDFEARPPGKKVKRMSLLSGGERSLTAIAYLLAIFKARPSPFYVLDEVEAALDDTNMQRLLQVFEELRASSQLIIVTHQKRTMEIADALYGVSMRGDGVSAVVSQRLRERESA